MNELNDDMKKMLAKQLPVQATSSPSGVPDIGPKRSLRLYDDRTLIYNENTGGQTLQNIREGSKMAVVVIDREALDGYRFVGTPELFLAGKPFDDALAFAEKNGMKPPKYAVLIHIDSIYTLRSGPNAGTRL
ncbi:MULTISPECIES: pyridoxamine 5'-phosphate oxidase family protein [Serratia]|uniref:Pyridoxamine 5'-phosphate oxidase family protein n=3 Tax=Serratia TaxID=613 RepID=A0AAW6X652_9GAMM|nr:MULTISPECIES: pyridoxamine 5'-phosphate oxidase family protein [Serratia]SAP62516.1 Pyridoxamine 5'-phosphate oxidase [Klebsiella oxytoca]AKL43818.1 pyridoxamine 5'-phosphate oxidase family protein [Serratia marcescens]AUY15111.1 pyridoxamine 5'-phosphate oxidase [Serratia sp. SSNIH1]AVU35571.1 pyridoxamine 5'-phosphate oxidase [Serratia marcescens]AVU40678.1 pyridoxamine 5'-phosphate oxidase [Serratia marcescens]